MKGPLETSEEALPTERQKAKARRDVLKNDIKMFEGQGSASHSKDSVGGPRLIEKAIEQYDNVLSEEKAIGPTPRKNFTQVAPSSFKFDRNDPVLLRRQQLWQQFVTSQSSQRPKNASRGGERRTKGSSALLSPSSSVTPA